MDGQMLFVVLVGFAAQLIDGAIGMAYGTFAMAALLAIGTAAPVASASVHQADTVTTGVSALAHLRHGHVRRTLFLPLAAGGIVGAVFGALVLVVAASPLLRGVVTVYLIALGLLLIYRQLRDPGEAQAPIQHRPATAALGFVGGALDAAGGGGWGPLVVATLLTRGLLPRDAIGSAIAAEWLVTLAASLTFLATIGVGIGPVALALVLGGLPAAPLGAWMAHRIPARAMMLFVGVTICALGVAGLVQTLV
jgi:hypothetical protein